MRRWILVLGLVVTAGVGLALARTWTWTRSSAPPPVLLPLPEFQLVDQDGRSFGRGDLLGKVVVADFVFLGCSEVCPRLTERMRAVQEKLRGSEYAGRVKLLTISVDPTNDTPERLRAYARSFGADPAIWSFLTGPAEEVERTVVKGFRVAMGKEPAPASGGEPTEGAKSSPASDILQIFHGEHFVLVDPQGRIRGYYLSDGAGLENLLRDLRVLL